MSVICGVWLKSSFFFFLCVSAPKVERVGDQSCEISWEALQPMKGDPISYTLQSMLGNSEFKQVTWKQFESV